jgi:hypothetical protein
MIQRSSNRELWYSLFAVLMLTIAYVFMVSMLNGIPAASDFFGHMIGVIGFVLMLMTETLYSLRKRSRSARWGRMAEWLDFHIFTGLVGPYLVLLHSSWKFNGLAGIVMLLTVIIVASGFVGRYIYTAVPRTADGVEVESSQVEAFIRQADQELQRWLETRPVETRRQVQMLAQPAQSSGNPMLDLLFRPLDELNDRIRWWRIRSQLDVQTNQQLSQLEKLLRQRQNLNRQIRTLAIARRLMSLWHTVHIPIGMALFSAAFIHIIAAIYYATLLH